MVFGLIGLLFNIVTFPGALVNMMVQSVVYERYGAPTRRIAVDESVDIRGNLADEVLKSDASLAGVDDDSEAEIEEGDTRGAMFDTETTEARSDIETATGNSETESDSSWFEIEPEKGYWFDTKADEEVIDAVRVLGDDEEPADDEKRRRVVDFDAVDRYPNMFKIVLVPLAVMTVLGVAILGLTTWFYTSGVLSDEGLVSLVPLWLGLSMAAHAFPNRHPTKALLLASRETKSPLRIIGYPIVGVSMLLNMLEFLWADAIYALALWYVIGLALGYF